MVTVRGSDPTAPVDLSRIVAPGDARGFNVVLITLDTTRPDHLGCYGDEAARTPAIDSLLQHGVRFDDAVTCVPITLPSHASMLTGLYPSRLGVRANGVHRLAPGFTTLAEVLRNQGYRTAAFVSCFVLDRRFGLDQGFETFDFQVKYDGASRPLALQNERRADHVTTSALEWLQTREPEGGDRPFFLWVHYFDPHHPYESPLANLEAFADRPYDAEIAFVDVHLKRLLAALDDQGLRERTLIVVASDHGEGLYEHDEPGHAIFVYESTMRAVLLLSCPALFDRPYRVDDRLVSLIDIYPTVVDLLGLPTPGGIDGQSLLGEAAPDRAIFIETLYPQITLACSPLRGVRRRGEKFILAPRPEYYDLTNDPKELHNRFVASDPKVADLQSQLAEFVARAERVTSDHAHHALSPDELRRLAALGYAGPTATGGVDISQCDPKDRVSQVNRLSEVHALVQSGRTDEALALALEVENETEGWVAPVRDLAQIYQSKGQWENAARVLGEFVARYPDVEMLCRLAEVCMELGRWDEFDHALQAAELLDPLMGAIPMLRGDRCVREGDLSGAVKHYERAREIDPDRVGDDIAAKLSAARAKLNE